VNKKTHSHSDASIKHFTRGGQTFLHNFRMINQIFSRVMITCFVIFIITVLGLTYFWTTPYQRRLIEQWIWGQIIAFFRHDATQLVTNANGETIKVFSQNFIDSILAHQAIQDVAKVSVKAMSWGLLITSIAFMIIYAWLRTRGEKQTETKQLRGDIIANWKEVNKLIKKSNQVSTIALSGLTLPKDFECRHLLIHGTTGSGKSVCIRELLDQIRARGDKAIIYDKGCDYVSTYYREGIDVLLNPLDKRTTPWHLWDECRDNADYDTLAAALMPMPQGGGDPFWVNAARTIFAAAARQLEANPNRSIDLLLKALLSLDLQALGLFLKGTEAETLVSDKAEKTAISIKSVLTTYIKSLQYVVDEQGKFSIRRWIQDDTQRNWLFISSISDRHETLKPLISMWLDIAANALMSLPPSNTRRIWIIFDELPSLQRLPYLPEAFAEARKFGGCLVAGMQSISQLRKIYGNHAAEEISNLCNTRIFFRDPSFETAQWASKELGESETEEMKENVSYSESAMRSGISITNQRLKQQIISASEVMHLNDLEAFVRLPGNLPITKIKLEYKTHHKISKPFVYRDRT
jgi:type IV conjugative transfer system coupling protein TraD